MNLLLGLVCDDARSNPDGKLDVHGVFHDLFAPGFPARQDRMVLVLVVEWDREDHGRYAFRVDLVDPDGRATASAEVETEVSPSPAPRPPSRTQLVSPLEDIVFPVPGTYRFRVRVKGHDLDGPLLHLLEAGSHEHE